jgi:hypothetical protein
VLCLERGQASTVPDPIERLSGSYAECLPTRRAGIQCTDKQLHRWSANGNQDRHGVCPDLFVLCGKQPDQRPYRHFSHAAECLRRMGAEAIIGDQPQERFSRVLGHSHKRICGLVRYVDVLVQQESDQSWDGLRVVPSA